MAHCRQFQALPAIAGNQADACREPVDERHPRWPTNQKLYMRFFKMWRFIVVYSALPFVRFCCFGAMGASRFARLATRSTLAIPALPCLFAVGPPCPHTEIDSITFLQIPNNVLAPNTEQANTEQVNVNVLMKQIYDFNDTISIANLFNLFSWC